MTSISPSVLVQYSNQRKKTRVEGQAFSLSSPSSARRFDRDVLATPRTSDSSSPCARSLTLTFGRFSVLFGDDGGSRSALLTGASLTWDNALLLSWVLDLVNAALPRVMEHIAT